MLPDCHTRVIAACTSRAAPPAPGPRPRPAPPAPGPPQGAECAILCACVPSGCFLP